MMLKKIKNVLLQMIPSPKPRRVQLKDNRSLSSAEFDLVKRIANIFAAIQTVAKDQVIPPPGGVFWSGATKELEPFSLYLRQDKFEIEHSYLLNNRFRDYPSIAYEHAEFTPVPDYWVRRYERLIKPMPGRWQVRMPARFGEIGWKIKRHPVNRWTSVNQERLNTLYAAGILTHLESINAPRLMEIGGGAGEMGYILSKALPRATWYDCDLLGSLFHSAMHQAVTLPKKKHYIYIGNLELPEGVDQSLLLRSAKEAACVKNAIVNVPNFLLDDFANVLKLDYAYNTYSFGEMPSSAVKHYVSLLADFLAPDGVLYEQNGYFPERGGDNPIDVIAAKFKQATWFDKINDGMLRNGSARIWTNSEKINKKLSKMSEPLYTRIASSFDDANDQIDIEYPVEIWDKLIPLFNGQVNE